jgi:hypothetical protein
MTLFLGELFVYGIEDLHAGSEGSTVYRFVEVLEVVYPAAWASKNSQAVR